MNNIPTLVGEEWRPIKGFPLYYFSNLNRVYKLPNPRQTKIRSGKTRYGLSRGTDNIPTSTSWLYREHFPYEFIKWLEEGEEVKPLSGHSGYFITNRGRVFSMWRYKFLSPSPCKDYYYQVSLGRGNREDIHTLVGRHFLSDYQKGLFICHKEENLSFPEINYVENLWVGTNSDNQRDSYDKGRGKHQHSETSQGTLQVSSPYWRG